MIGSSSDGRVKRTASQWYCYDCRVLYIASLMGVSESSLKRETCDVKLFLVKRTRNA